MMKITWDEAKRIANLQKHGFDFEDVYFFDWKHAVITTSHAAASRLSAIMRTEPLSSSMRCLAARPFRSSAFAQPATLKGRCFHDR
jgi:uncharacterized DUF497 family protein